MNFNMKPEIITCSSDNIWAQIDDQNSCGMLFWNKGQAEAHNAKTNMADSQTFANSKIDGRQHSNGQTNDVHHSSQEEIVNDISIQIGRI